MQSLTFDFELNENNQLQFSENNQFLMLAGPIDFVTIFNIQKNLMIYKMIKIDGMPSIQKFMQNSSLIISGNSEGSI